MANKEKAYGLLYQNYRQFIQFINDLWFPSLLYLVIMYLPLLTIFGDLLSHINPTNFLYNLSSISLSSLILKLSTQLPQLLLFVKILILLSLLLPIFIVFIICVFTLRALTYASVEIGYFHQCYINSTVCRIMRLFINVFQRVLFPIFISIAIKIAFKDDINSDKTVGILIIILTFVNSLIFHYYCLEIPTGKSYQLQHQQINFPNPILESVFIFVIIIIVNATTDMIPYIGCVCLFVLMAIISRFLRYENQQLYPQYQFSLLCANSISLALLIGYFNNHPSIMAFTACLTIMLLVKSKKKTIMNSMYYQQIGTKTETDELTIEDVKKNLRSQKIAKAFRQAVFISRRKNSHRMELTIDIIKSKCYSLECQSRGSTKTADSNLLLKFQVRIIEIIKKTLEVQQKSIDVLTIMKSKEPKQEFLIKTVVELVDLIEQNKRNFIECIKINALAVNLNILMNLFFKVLYNDGIFLRQVRSKYRDEVSQINYNRIQKQLFSKDAALVVVNISDEIGKITKVSNNMPNVLGYSSHTLIGMSINGLIPLTIREIHDDIVKNFINNFSSQVMRKKPSVQFYAYNKMFHLQKVQVRYKFFLHQFSNCQLSSVLRTLKTQQYVILTDQHGNIEGWTAQIGEIFNFDQLSGAQCNAYNLIPLIPAYAKYDSRQNICFKTLFFRLSKMKTPRIMLIDSKEKIIAQDLKKKQVKVFLQLLQKGEIIQAFFVSVTLEIKHLQRFNRIMKVFKLSELKRLQNFQHLEKLILKKVEKNTNQQNDNYDRFDFNPSNPDKQLDESLDADFSILKQKNVEIVNADLNFSLDPQDTAHLSISDLKFSKDIDRFQSICSTRSLLKLDIQGIGNEANSLNQNLSLESNFDPKLQRNNNFLWVVVTITIVVVSMIIQDQIALSSIFLKLESNKTQIYRSNRAQMIYCKSVFNLNSTYIQQFQKGALQVQSQWLFQNNLTYIAYTGDNLIQNNYYLLNVQIPSTLQRALYFEGPTNQYLPEIQKNFYNVIQLYQQMFQNLKSAWQVQIQSAKAQCSYKMIAFSGGALVYLFFLILIWYGFKKQRKMTEAFFKFEKTDLNDKINQIMSITTTLQKRCTEWFIDEYLNEIKKQKQPVKKETFLETQCEVRKELQGKKSQSDFGYSKIQGGQQTDEFETKISEKRFCFIIGLIAFILLTQVLFLILHGVLSSQMLNNCKDIVDKFDQANKLTVYPNLKIASLFYHSPAQILTSYENLVQKTLDQPISSMPSLLKLLSEKPCSDCNFLSDILNTNYRSFYSYFIQLMASYKESGDKLKQLYYAVDVVTQNITLSLTTEPVESPRSVIVIYLFSVLIFFGSVVIILRKLEQEYSKLECFLKFFHQQALLKNKHMSTVMAKNM